MGIINTIIFLSIIICRVVACDSSMITITRMNIREDTTKYRSTLVLIESIKKQDLSVYELPGGLCGCDPGGYVVEDLFDSSSFFHFNWCGNPDHIVLLSNSVSQFDFLPKYYLLNNDSVFQVMFKSAKIEWIRDLNANKNR